MISNSPADLFSALNPAQAPEASRSRNVSDMGSDDFLTLMIAQMKNQDPTKPMESTEYVAQLASFSNVEQTVQTNEKLDRLLSSSFMSNAGSLIGKNISNADGTIAGRISQVRVVDGVGSAVLASGATLAIDSTVTISE